MISSEINEYYILPCLQELKQFAIAGSFSEPEQTPGFFKGDKISEIPYDEFYKEWTGKRSTNDNYNKMKQEYKSMVISDFSTYGFDTVCKNIDLMKKWEIYTRFLCDKFGADNTNDNTKNVAFFITHHNRMKDITQGLLPTEKVFGYANNCCIKIQIDKADNNISVSINVLFQGYPDKPDSNKTGGGSSYNYVNPNNFPLLHKDHIENGIKTGMRDDIQNITIYVIRHGNSLHNEPSKKKKIDSSLTPLGMYQAIKLVEQIKDDVMDTTKHGGAIVKFILCCSFLQRTQLTGLSIMKQLNALNDNTKDLNIMETNAITRFTKEKLDIKIFNKFSPLNSNDDYQQFDKWYKDINPYNKIIRIGPGGKLNQMHITLKVKSHKRKYKRLASKRKTQKRNRRHTKK